jgi:putative glutamine amidotransferase
MRPLIGITTYAQEASWGVWRLPAALIPLDYVDAIERAGGRPVLIPPSEDGVDETLEALDGIVFSGGADVAPVLYGADPHAETDEPQRRRDAGEMALLRAALDCDLPTLAVCRGVQLMNVARGGDLVQHLPDRVGHERHRETPGTFSEHAIEVQPGSRLQAVVGLEPRVTSHHHQSLGRVGEGLVEAAWADDGTVEAVEDPTRRFALGVQWHPESGNDDTLLEALVEEARAYRNRRRGRS